MLINVDEYEDKQNLLDKIDEFVNSDIAKRIYDDNVLQEFSILTPGRCVDEIKTIDPDRPHIDHQDWISVGIDGEIYGWFHVSYELMQEDVIFASDVMAARLKQTPSMTFARDMRKFHDMIRKDTTCIFMVVTHDHGLYDGMPQYKETTGGERNILQYYGGVEQDQGATIISRDGTELSMKTWKFVTPKGIENGWCY